MINLRFINILAIISVVSYFFEVGFHLEGSTPFLWMERIIAFVFSWELIYQIKFQKNYLWRTEFWIDLISVAPFWIGFFISPEQLSNIRFLRTIRIFKLFWNNSHFDILETAFKLAWPSIKSAAFCLICICLFAAALLFQLEPDTFGNIGNSLYFSLTTACTVGFGDYSPKTPGGKLVTIALLYGPALLVAGALVGIVGSAYQIASDKMKKS